MDQTSYLKIFWTDDNGDEIHKLEVVSLDEHEQFELLENLAQDEHVILLPVSQVKQVLSASKKDDDWGGEGDGFKCIIADMDAGPGPSTIDLYFNPKTREVKEVKNCDDGDQKSEHSTIFSLDEFDPQNYGAKGEEFLQTITTKFGVKIEE